MKRIFFAALLLTYFISPGFTQDFESHYKQLLSLEKQVSELQAEYNREKQSNNQRLVRIQQAKSKGNTQAAESELRDAYVSAERLGELNGKINEKRRALDALCTSWGKLYGPNVDALLAEAEKTTNSKRRAEIGTQLQKYQSINSRLCLKSFNTFSTEWKTLQIEPYDGPQEIKQKVQLLKDISREMSIGIARFEEQYQQASRERLTRERAQEFVDEGTLFDGGITVRSQPKGEGGVDTAGYVPFSGEVDRNKGETEAAPTDVMSVGSSWNDIPATEADYKKQRSDLTKQQEELQQKIKEFEEKEKALLKP
jgi:hypothetical protein